jgi:hypothetical protein
LAELAGFDDGDGFVTVIAGCGWLGSVTVGRYAEDSSAAVRSTGARHFGHFADRLPVSSSGSFSRFPHALQTRRTAIAATLHTALFLRL